MRKINDFQMKVSYKLQNYLDNDNIEDYSHSNYQHYNNNNALESNYNRDDSTNFCIIT